MKKYTYLIHGFLFAGGCAVNIYMSGVAGYYIPAGDIIFPTLIAVGGFVVFVVIGYLLTRKLEIAGLLATFFILGFFYLWDVFLLILLCTLTSLLLFRIIFKRVTLLNLNVVLITISIAVVGFYLFQFISLLTGLPRVRDQQIIQPILDQPASLASENTPPDIYYLILDGYGRADMLQEVYGFDNSGFVAALEQRGFVVGTGSQANYHRSTFSLASSMNMQYLDSMSSVMGNSQTMWPVRDTVQHSELRRILESLEYKTVFFASSWDETDIRDGDYYETPYPVMLNNFNSFFLHLTNLRILEGSERLGLTWQNYDTHRELILYDFHRLPEVAAIPSPKFVFAHILAAHAPYVFDRLGNPVNPDDPYSLLASPNPGERTIDQMIYMNREIITAIDGILANSATPPVIVLQGDHGPEMYMDFNSIEGSCLYERFSILNAYHLPGISRDSIPVDLAPVNSFRFIFNHYFQTRLELLPNQQYFSLFNSPWQFVEVTGQTQTACEANPGGGR